MGIFDNIRKKATKAVDDHGDKIAKGIDKAAGMADAKTKGKYSDKVGKGSRAAKDALDKLDGRNDDIPAPQTPPQQTPPPPPQTPATPPPPPPPPQQTPPPPAPSPPPPQPPAG